MCMLRKPQMRTACQRIQMVVRNRSNGSEITTHSHIYILAEMNPLCDCSHSSSEGICVKKRNVLFLTFLSRRAEQHENEQKWKRTNNKYRIIVVRIGSRRMSFVENI